MRTHFISTKPGQRYVVLDARQLPEVDTVIAWARRTPNVEADEELARVLNMHLDLMAADLGGHRVRRSVGYSTTRPRGKPMRCEWFLTVEWEVSS